MNRALRRHRWIILILPLAGCVTVPPATQPADHGDHAAAAAGKPAPMDRDKMWQSALARTPRAATAAFDAGGRLWLAAVREGHVTVRHSDDQGRTFSDEVRVNPVPEYIAADGENRPKIAFGIRGETYVSWTQSLESPFSGHVRFSRSLDGGRSFSPPLTVNDNLEAISHRFDSMIVTPKGDIHIAWLDKRDAQAAARDGLKYTGISVYTAVSTDQGESFHPNRKLADHSCECCRISMALDASGVPVIVWRHIYGQNTRDHALLRLDGKSQPVRVSEDNWAIDACPHHGPGLAISADGTYHLVWFTNAPNRQGLFYARSTDTGRRFSAPLGFGNGAAQAGHAQVLSRAKSVFIAWKEFDGSATSIRVMRSDDNGNSWSAPVTVSKATATSDHPLLIAHGDTVYLSWNTQQDGHRLIALDTVKAGK